MKINISTKSSFDSVFERRVEDIIKCMICGEDLNMYGGCACNNYTYGKPITTESKIKTIIERYYGEILTNLDEVGINVDDISLDIKIYGKDFEYTIKS
jgi:hypothetical protein